MRNPTKRLALIACFLLSLVSLAFAASAPTPKQAIVPYQPGHTFTVNTPVANSNGLVLSPDKIPSGFHPETLAVDTRYFPAPLAEKYPVGTSITLASITRIDIAPRTADTIATTITLTSLYFHRGGMAEITVNLLDPQGKILASRKLQNHILTNHVSDDNRIFVSLSPLPAPHSIHSLAVSARMEDWYTIFRDDWWRVKP